MGTNYRSTGTLKYKTTGDIGEFDFDDSLQAQIGQPTKASQYNAMEENANFLFFSTMHGRRGHTPECESHNMNECESGRIWAIGVLNPSNRYQTLFAPKASGENVTIPFDLTGRLLTVRLIGKCCTEDVDLDKLLPGGENEAEFPDAGEYGIAINSIFYTGPGVSIPEDEITKDTSYVLSSSVEIEGNSGTIWLYIYVRQSDRSLRIKLSATTQEALEYAHIAYIADITYSPRIPYYGES